MSANSARKTQLLSAPQSTFYCYVAKHTETSSNLMTQIPIHCQIFLGLISCHDDEAKISFTCCPPPPRWPHSSEGLYSEQSKSVSMTHILLGIVMDCLVTPTEFPVQLQNRREQSLAMSGRASPNCCCAVALRHRKMAAIFCECRPDNCTRTSILQY